MDDYFALFDNSLDDSKKSILLTHPIHEVKAYDLQDIYSALKKIDTLKNEQFYVAGYLNYECAYAFFNMKGKHDNTKPLLHFYSFKNSQELNDLEVKTFLKEKVQDNSPTALTQFSLQENFGTYKEKLSQLKEYLQKGETYQVNYTMDSHFELSGDIYSLYLQLRHHQPVEYGAFINFPEHKILSFSPELFFKKEQSRLMSKPMKGTMARSAHPDTDKKIVQQMRQDEKIISENLMIVDMIRNDLSRISKSGSVKAEKLFAIETYKTLHQMTSTVTSEVSSAVTFSHLIKNLFPCASITGAPKKRTIEIIQELENRVRGIYTGAIGFITPQNDMCFNVPIRTIVSQGTGVTSMGLGGGILHESSTEDEYQECLDKSLFLKKVNQDFYLIESFAFENDSFINLTEHLNRLEQSAQEFSFSCPTSKIKRDLEKLKFQESAKQKIRIQLFFDGEYKISTEPLIEEPIEKFVNLCSNPIDSKNIFLKHKTSHRFFYESTYTDAQKNGLYEILFFNEKEELTEACRHNVFLQINGELYTPPVSSGLLPGIQRQSLINDGALEKVLSLKDLKEAEKVFLTNSVRGTVEVTLK